MLFFAADAFDAADLEAVASFAASDAFFFLASPERPETSFLLFARFGAIAR